MLAHKGAASALCTGAEVLNSAGALAAYRVLANQHRIPFLGPAFGTKFLYFASAPDKPALILDRLVSLWLNDNGGVRFNYIAWDPAEYARYLDLMFAWSAALEVIPADLESRIFQAQADKAGSQWGRASDPDGSPVG